MVASCWWERVMTSPSLSRRIGKDDYGVHSDHRTAGGGGIRVRHRSDQHPIDGSERSIGGKDLRGTDRGGDHIPERQEAPPVGKVREATVCYTAVEPNRNIEFEA